MQYKIYISCRDPMFKLALLEALLQFQYQSPALAPLFQLPPTRAQAQHPNNRSHIKSLKIFPWRLLTSKPPLYGAFKKSRPDA